MFRSSNLESSTPIDNNSAINGLGGFNMYLDTSITHNMSPPMSSATMSPPTTPLTPEPTMASTQFPLLTDNNQLNTALLQRQYQYHLLIQHHQQQLALAQHQLALAASAAAASHQQNDEIAHSLKMFALLTACNADSSSLPTQDVMQDFASNGYASDDLNRFQYSNQSCPTSQPLQSQMPRQQYANSTTGASTSSSAAAEVTAAHLFNLNNYREHLSNVWRSMTMGYMPNNNIAASPGIPMASGSIKNINPVGMAMPSDHMRNVSNVNISNNNNNNRQQKRFNNQKSKEHVHRHCVFCENNNEPEAVVNSHSVRDNYGRVLCPKLRTYVCPICGASGDSAHTIKYCPKKPIVTMEDAIKAESFRLAKGNYYKQQMKV